MNMYRTTDFYLTCFLSLKGHSYSMERKGRICDFLFEESEELNKSIEEYYSNCSIKILDFKNKLRDLKSQIINLRDVNNHYDEDS